MSLEEGWKSRVQEMYKTSEVLDVKHAIHNNYTTVPINFWHEILSRFELDHNDTFLDIGCGTGELCQSVQTIYPAATIIGLDIASEVLSHVKSRTDPSISYLAGDGEKLAFPDNSIDVVTAIHSLSYMRNIDAAVSQIHRVLKKSSSLIATTNSLRSYPHVSEYRNRIFSIYGWGNPVFPSTYFNLENMYSVLKPHFQQVELSTLIGELSIPVAQFLPYFNANIDVWDQKVSPEDRVAILDQVYDWAVVDAENDKIVESKYVGLALCNT